MFEIHRNIASQRRAETYCSCANFNPKVKGENPMKYDLKKFTRKYKNKSITECVELAKSYNEEMIQRGEQLVGLLWYLEKTKRFKEYEGYEKLGFKDFVWEICHIPYNRYRELAYAYNWYPQESRELGPQTIQTIRSRVGVMKIPKVLAEIKKAVEKVNDPLKRREAVNNIIEKHSPPKPKSRTAPEDTKAYWKAKYEKLYADYMALLKENKELHEQLERQKGPITAYLSIKDQIMKQPEVRVQ